MEIPYVHIVGRTATGEKVYVKVKSDGSLEVVPARVVKHIDLQRTASLGAGATENDIYTVPAGKAWLGIIGNCAVSAPVGATSGTHRTAVYLQGSFTVLDINISKSYTASFWGSDIIDHGVNGHIGAGKQLKLTYMNSTDVAQTNARNWFVTYIEEVN